MRNRFVVEVTLLVSLTFAHGCSRSVAPPEDSGSLVAEIVPPKGHSFGKAPFPSNRVSNGILVTTYSHLVGEWGNSEGQTLFSVPNPFAPEVYACSLVVELRQFSTFHLWIEPVLGPGERGMDDHLQDGITGTQIPKSRTIVRDFGEIIEEAGYVLIAWDGRADDGNELPAGFYRICATDTRRNERAWGDVLLLRRPGDRPASMHADPWEGGWVQGD